MDVSAISKSRESVIAKYQAQIARMDNRQRDIDFVPVVKLPTPNAQCTWLLTELDPKGGLAFGLCDLGMGEPELGYVSLVELSSVRGKLGLPIERDRHFRSRQVALRLRRRGASTGIDCHLIRPWPPACGSAAFLLKRPSN